MVLVVRLWRFWLAVAVGWGLGVRVRRRGLEIIGGGLGQW